MTIYELVAYIGKYAKEDAIIVSDAGSAFYVTAQAYPFKDGDIHVTDGGQAAMGACLPMCLGAHYAAPSRQVIGITGDGSFMFCLPTMYSFPEDADIKIFVVCNDGYLSLKNTQDAYFEGRHIGTMKGLNIEVAYECIPVEDEEGVEMLMSMSGLTVAAAHTDPNEKIIKPVFGGDK